MRCPSRGYGPAVAEPRSLPSATQFTRRSATYIGSFTFAARLVERLGAFGQIAVIASIFGSSFVADRYFVASIVPLIIGAITGEALSANIMPALVRSRGAATARLVAAGFWLSAAILVLITLVYLGVAAIVVERASPAGSRGLGVWYAFAAVGPLLGLSGFLSAVLTFHERYVWPPFRSALASAGGFVLMLVVAAFSHDLVWLGAAVTGGYLLSFLALVVETRRVAGSGSLAAPTLGGLRAAIALGGGLASPVLGGLLGGQIFVLLERALASTIGVGAVSILSYARGVVFTPVIVAQSIALGIYPGMVRAYEAGDLEHVRGALLRGIRLTLFLAACFAAFFAAFGREAIAVLLQRGAFEPQAATAAGTVIAAFSLALLGNMVMIFTARLFYAVDYFRGVVWVQIWVLVVYAAVALPLRAHWHASGLAFAFGLAEASAAVYSLVLAGRRVGLTARRAALTAGGPALARAAVVAAAFGALRLTADAGVLGGSFVRLAAAIAAGLVVGGAVLWSANWPELGRVRRRLRRLLSV